MATISSNTLKNLLRYLAAGLIMLAVVTYHDYQETLETPIISELRGDAAETLALLEVKGRSPKTGYDRSKFGDGWRAINGCDTRQFILQRDLQDIHLDDDGCTVIAGRLADPYTGQTLDFTRGPETSDDIQVDHVVALSDAWQKGAQALSYEQRVKFANDPLELLAVEGDANQQKGDGDAATWLPKNKSYRCSYVSRQIAVKAKYKLWVTQAEQDAMARVLKDCPGQQLPS